jgi:exodeoxyribonuclease VII large subunit
MRQMNLFSSPEPMTPMTVGDLTRYIREMFEVDYRLQDVLVEGEVSGVSRPSSGHIYFTLKDTASQIACVMWKTSTATYGALLVHGGQIVAHGKVSVYEPRGSYQLYVDRVQPIGLGDLHAQFELLKTRLEAEGLFVPERKRPLPEFPRRIGVVTSPTGAVIRDICKILARRWPLVGVILAPTQVQGDDAPPQIVAALDALYRRDDLDLIIVARGGGSLEDLQAFNDERVARKLADSPVPIVSGVGHETDFTIADFVADLRAPTPSAAAELTTPDRAEVATQVRALQSELVSTVTGDLRDRRVALQSQMRSLAHLSPQARLANLRQRADDLISQATLSVSHHLQLRRVRLIGLVARLDALNPLAVLRRGYAVVRREGQLVRSVAQVSPGDRLSVRVSDGEFDATARSGV